jgi:hypothetical protein
MKACCNKLKRGVPKHSRPQPEQVEANIMLL